MSSDLYVKRAIADVETELKKINQTLQNKVGMPLSSDHRPELDQSPELDLKRANYFQSLIGVLRWTVELGRVDIMVAVSMLSRYLIEGLRHHIPQVAVRQSLEYIEEKFSGRAGIIGITAYGSYFYGFNTAKMAFGFVDGKGKTVRIK